MNSEKDKVMIAVLGAITIIGFSILLAPILVGKTIELGVDLGAKL